MKLAIGNDHSDPQMKAQIKAHLEARGIEVIDVIPPDADSLPYPVSGYKVAKLVAENAVSGGVLLCGTGVGISLAANKVAGIRACVCSEPFTARQSKLHNNANIIAFGTRVVGIEMAKAIVDAWLDTEYEGGRHDARLEIISQIEKNENIL